MTATTDALERMLRQVKSLPAITDSSIELRYDSEFDDTRATINLGSAYRVDVDAVARFLLALDEVDFEPTHGETPRWVDGTVDGVPVTVQLTWHRDIDEKIIAAYFAASNKES